MSGCASSSLGLNPNGGIEALPDAEREDAVLEGPDAGTSDLGMDAGNATDAGYPTYTLISGDPPDVYIDGEVIPVTPWKWEPTAVFNVGKICPPDPLPDYYPLPEGEETSVQHGSISGFEVFLNGQRPAALCGRDGTWAILDTDSGGAIIFSAELQDRIESELSTEIKRPYSPLTRVLGSGLWNTDYISNSPGTWTAFPIELDDNRFWIPFQDFPPFDSVPNRFGLAEVNLDTEDFSVFWEDSLPLEVGARGRSIAFRSVQGDKLILGVKVSENVELPDGTTRLRYRLTRLETFDLENESHLSTIILPTEPLNYGEDTFEGLPWEGFEGSSVDIEFGDVVGHGDDLWISHYPVLRTGGGPLLPDQQPGPATLSRYNLNTGEWIADAQLPMRGAKGIAFLEGEESVVVFGLLNLRIGDILPEETRGLVAQPALSFFSPESMEVTETQTLPVPESTYAADMLYDSKLTVDGGGLFVDAGGGYRVRQEGVVTNQIFGMSYQESAGVYVNEGESAQPFVSIGAYPYTFMEDPGFGNWFVPATVFNNDYETGHLLARGFNRDMLYVDFLASAAYSFSIPGETPCHAFYYDNILTFNEDGTIADIENPIYKSSCAPRLTAARILGDRLLVGFGNDIFVANRP